MNLFFSKSFHLFILPVIISQLYCYDTTEIKNDDNDTSDTSDPCQCDVKMYQENAVEEDDNVNENSDNTNENPESIWTSASYTHDIDESAAEGDGIRQPVVMLHCARHDPEDCETKALQWHTKVLKLLGYKVIPQYIEGVDFDLLYAYMYPWSEEEEDEPLLPLIEKALKPHQRISHIPGEDAVSHKATLTTSAVPGIPKSFYLPDEEEDFLEYLEENDRPYWVEKYYGHKGVKVIEKEDIDTEKDVLIQEFIENPLLLDGYKIDLGIYTAITSINPLRVYIFDAEWRVKSCQKPYEPFNARNQAKYIVPTMTDTTVQQFLPSFQEYVETGINRQKDLLFQYLKDEGYDTSTFEKDVQKLTRDMVMYQEHLILEEIEKYSNITRNYFALTRTDFIVDDDMNVYLLETNGVPDMHAKKFKIKAMEILHGFFNMLNLAHPTLRNDVLFRPDDALNMRVSDQDIEVFKDDCYRAGCAANCQQDEICQLCLPCLTDIDKADLKAAFLEHVNKHNFVRVFPAPFSDQSEAAEPPETVDYDIMTPRSRWMSEWFRGKCLQDKGWCQ